MLTIMKHPVVSLNAVQSDPECFISDQGGLFQSDEETTADMC